MKIYVLNYFRSNTDTFSYQTTNSYSESLAAYTNVSTAIDKLKEKAQQYIDSLADARDLVMTDKVTSIIIDYKIPCYRVQVEYYIQELELA